MNGSTWSWTAVALIVLMGLGRGLLAMIAPPTPLYRVERWALSFLLGTGAGAFLWFACSPLYGVVSPVRVITAMALGALGVASAVRRAEGAKGAGLSAVAPSGAEAEGARGADVVLGAFLAIECVVLVLAALRTPLGWDALFNFEIKARLAMENVPAGRLPLAYFSDASRSWSHPAYPLVVPFAEFWIYSWLGRVDQSAIKILFPLFYFSLIGIVYGAVRRMTDRTVALACAVVLGLLPPLTVQPGAISGYADVPLAAAFAGAVSLTAMAFRSGQRDALWLAAALSAVAAWTKSEGLILAIALGVSAVLAQWLARTGSPRQMGSSALALLGLPLLIASPWLVVQHVYGMPQQGDFQKISLAAFAANLHKLPTIIALVARELLRPGHWALVWPAFVLACGVSLQTRRATATDWLLTAGVWIPLAVYALVFVFSAWPDVREHMGWSLARLLVPLAPIALMFAVTQVWRQCPEAAEWA